MKIERIAAEQIKAVLDGYEEQIAYYSDRGDKMNVRYINGVRSGFCRALQMLDVAGIEVDQVPVVRNGMHVDCVSFDVGRASVDPDQVRRLRHAEGRREVGEVEFDARAGSD